MYEAWEVIANYKMLGFLCTCVPFLFLDSQNFYIVTLFLDWKCSKGC